MPTAPTGLITLTTDFGSCDHFAGVMKGVILGLAPRARLVDITHEITPFEIAEGPFTIAQSWRYFPKGTIHVVVVDPGVGSARRPILVEAADHYFIGPDNGVFSMIYDAAPHKVREIANPKLMLQPVSHTFHGRDIFAPAAAHLARRIPAARFGKPVSDPVHIPALAPTQIAPDHWTGRVLKTDRFGNLITNFPASAFAEVITRPFELRAGSATIRRAASSYSEARPSELFAIEGSSGCLEIAVNQGSAAKIANCGSGAPLDLIVPL